jgi:hypothetical protein
MVESDEREFRKKAIFDGMSKRGRERVLKIGYENWDPFELPKDPRERIFSSASVRAGALVREYYGSACGGKEESTAVHRELFELCLGLLQGDGRAKTLVDFCAWLHKKTGGESA